MGRVPVQEQQVKSSAETQQQPESTDTQTDAQTDIQDKQQLPDASDKGSEQSSQLPDVCFHHIQHNTVEVP